MRNLTAWRKKKEIYGGNSTLRSVHHASVMVPSVIGTSSEISFLNHFLLKRDYRDVACRITAVDGDGNRIESILFEINEPRAYVFDLRETFREHGGDEATTFIVDFFCKNNLFYSLPAVMVNHRSDGCVSTVHAHLRILNDVFENDWVGDNPPIESSIDVIKNDEMETFFSITAGTQDFRGDIPVEFVTQSKTKHKKELSVDIVRLQTREFTISEMFPELGNLDGGILRIWRPHQFLLYGRLMSGVRNVGGSVSANHSFYDYSDTKDYFDNRKPSDQVYPYWHDLGQKFRIYPTQPSSFLRFSLTFEDANKKFLGSVDVGEIISPSDTYLDLDITSEILKANLSPEKVMSVLLRATPLDDRAPTRVNHQLAFTHQLNSKSLPASINFALQNENRQTFKKEGFAWGQMIVGETVETRVGLTTHSNGMDSEVEIEFYGQTGLVFSTTAKIPAGGCLKYNSAELFQDWTSEQHDKNRGYIWYLAKGGDPSLRAVGVTRHKDSGHLTSEHNF